MKTARHTKFRRNDLILFLERLELYVSSGMAIDRALGISVEGATAKQKNAIRQVLTYVERGGTLSKALSDHIGLSKTSAGLIEHGEASGQLAQALRTAQSLLQREDELFKKCSSALTYPAVIGLFATLLTIGLVKGVMPQIIPMLKGLHVQLPLLTRVVMSASDSLLSYGLYALAFSAGAVITSTILYRKARMFRSFVHSIIVRLPLVGSLAHSYSLAVFLRSCGALLESGAPIERAYASTARTVSFIPLQIQLESRISGVVRGIPVGTIFAYGRMPPYVAPLINAGEVSGTLGASMSRAAAILDRSIEHSLKRLTALIEPVMMAGMGMVVGSIALSIMMPIYDISKVLQK